MFGRSGNAGPERDSGSRITVAPAPASGLQADQKFLDLIADRPWRATYSRRTDLADSIMTAIVLAPFAPADTRFTDLGRLREPADVCSRGRARDEKRSRCVRDSARIAGASHASC